MEGWLFSQGTAIINAMPMRSGDAAFGEGQRQDRTTEAASSRSHRQAAILRRFLGTVDGRDALPNEERPFKAAA